MVIMVAFSSLAIYFNINISAVWHVPCLNRFGWYIQVFSRLSANKAKTAHMLKQDYRRADAARLTRQADNETHVHVQFVAVALVIF